jgi:uncharacterized HAD superfamily protein
MQDSPTQHERAIYVDLDDVLCETAQHCLQIVERDFGRSVKFESLTVFDLGLACSLTSDERERLYRTIHEPEEMLHLTPIPEAISVLREWSTCGYEIAIVTGRPPETLEATESWLERHDVPHDSITLVDKYGRFDTAGTCAIGLHDLKARRYAWAVEDSLPMAHFLGHDMGLDVLLIDRPWNQSTGLHPNVSRHRDWRSILRRRS